MQMVIEISEEAYNKLMQKSMLMSASAIDEAVDAIKKGVVLPKGHDDLIDRGLLRERINEDKREAFTKHEVWLLASKYNTDVPVLIPADKDGD